jgi:ATP-binding cassette subfamily C (CFTR/MRP) protein 1
MRANLPLIVIVAVVIGLGYQYFAAFYRASAREVKRLGVYYTSTKMSLEFLRPFFRFDAAIPLILSSFRIANWSDNIYCPAFKPKFFLATGLPTIRTYGEITRFMKENEYYIDLENRALFLTVTNQR